MTEQESKRRYPPVDVRPGKVYVFGSVRRPGMFDHEEGLTLLRAVEMAGGVLPDASMRMRVMIVRAGEPERPAVEADLEKVMKKQAPGITLDKGAVVDVESKCVRAVAPVQRPHYDTVPKRRRAPAR